jgi:hypothetical protein
LRLNAEANARCSDTARWLSDVRAPIHCGRYTIGSDASVEMETVANLRSPHTGSQQIGTIDTNTTIPIIEVDFAEPGMCVPIHPTPYSNYNGTTQVTAPPPSSNDIEASKKHWLGVLLGTDKAS